MRYSYFPGCSLKGTGKAYEESLLPVLKALDIEVHELEDWNCCGATAYMAVDESAALKLSARNLAIAEKAKDEVLAPCSACYLVLRKTQKYIQEYPKVGGEVRQALQNAGLEYSGNVEVKHPLDILVNKVGLDAIKKRVKKPLTGLKVATYYGCQIVRPYSAFDNQARPVAMDKLMEALGATVVHYPLKTRCCGGSLTGTISDVGLRLVYILLKEARKNGADIITTLCPLCQFNLDAFQDQIKSRYDDVTTPVVYFTQLMGLAFGIPESELGLKRNIVPAEPALAGKV
ncbi:MAG: CoB--CoM heterodisulfide reductase iron-sulfur subunit B family protein [Elusimicrobiota bacterium]|jgi:heterodisulfide reductase subunit B